MKIKIRLALQFTLIVAGILLSFSVFAYYFSFSSQQSKFRQSLLERATSTATLLIDVAEVDSSLLMRIQESTTTWENEEFVLTDSAFNVIYSFNSDYLSDRGALIYNHSKGGHKYFYTEGKDGVSYLYHSENKVYYAFLMATDKSRVANLKELREILLWSILFSLSLSVLFSYLFAGRAIRPIADIIRTVKEINSLKLNKRLDEGNKKDEIAQLAVTFNEMLSELEVAFRNQEDFVSNASHELRTPLTVMIGESDYFVSHRRSADEYEEHVKGLVNDLKNLNSLINSLLELAQINRERIFDLPVVRIDEVVFTAIRKVKEKYIDRKILPRINYPESGSELFVNGNEGLLEIAFINIIDNACKFSDHDVLIDFNICNSNVSVIIKDEGRGIPNDEIETIREPFKRASNAKFIGGYGIGLSLVYRIIEIHEAKLNIFSKINEGTSFELTFKRTLN
ncbi:MAG TPA: HAMP domain-containing sensor histidine kinase [Bacteroidales bacterium]|nr:HAMP domain-containing sensor histidine kinase [Bacteroidales bacterium]